MSSKHDVNVRTDVIKENENKPSTLCFARC